MCLAGFAAFLNIWSSHSGGSRTRENVVTPPLTAQAASSSPMATAVVSAGAARQGAWASRRRLLRGGTPVWLPITWPNGESGPGPPGSEAGRALCRPPPFLPFRPPDRTARGCAISFSDGKHPKMGTSETRQC